LADKGTNFNSGPIIVCVTILFVYKHEKLPGLKQKYFAEYTKQNSLQQNRGKNA
jgi:hypothetical protein